MSRIVFTLAFAASGLLAQAPTPGPLIRLYPVALPEPDERGAIAMLVAAATRPGNCELQVTAIQGNESATEHIAYLAVAQ